MTREEEYQNALNGYMNLDVQINKTLRLIGISAIKKQIPKKPIEKTFGTQYCAVCGATVGQRITKVFYEDCLQYCGKCGQKQDWSEEDD